MAHRPPFTMNPPRWLILWTVANLAPFYFCFDTFLKNSWRYVSKEPGAIPMSGTIILFSLNLALILFEGTLAAILVNNLRAGWRHSSVSRATGAGITFLALTGYQLLLCMSWYMFTSRATFITNDELRLAQFAEDSAWISSVVTTHEIRIFALFLAVSVLSTLILFRSVTADVTRQKYGPALLRFLLGSCAATAVISAYAWTMLPKSERLQIGETAHGFLSPQLALAYGNVIFPHKTETTVVLDEQSLIPIESLDSYAAGVERASLRKKNVVIVLVEALRADMVAPFGGDPRILPITNAIAHSGTAVRGYSQATETSEARLSILTSLYNLKSPARDLRHSWKFPHTFLYELLDQFGYKTSLITESWNADRGVSNINKLSLAIDPLHFDFSSISEDLNPWKDRTSRNGEYSAAVADRMKVTMLNDWIRQQTGPFFSLIYFLSSHFPYEQAPAIPKLFSPTEISNGASFLSYPASDTASMKNRYMNTLHYIDSLIGEIVRTLEQKGILNDTVIVITGDHGEYFHEHGQVTHSGHVYEEGIAVPIIFSEFVSIPSDFKNALRMGHIDIGPTILETIGLPPYGNFQGISLKERIRFLEERKETLPVFSSSQMFTHEDSIVEWPWKLVINHRGYPDRLVNLEVDPTEASNLASQYPKVTSALQKCLRQYRGEQLSYYSSKELSKVSFPPSHQGRCLIPNT